MDAISGAGLIVLTRDFFTGLLRSEGTTVSISAPLWSLSEKKGGHGENAPF